MLILFIRGWGVSEHDMKPLESILSQHISFESIHISASELILNTLSEKQMAAMATDVPKYIIAWSLGGTYVITHFHQFKAVEGLVLLSTPPALLQTEAFPTGWSPKILCRMLDKLKVNPHEVMKDFRERLTFESLEEAHAETRQVVTFQTFESDLDHLNPSDASEPALRRLSELEIDSTTVHSACCLTRTLIVQGIEDVIVCAESASALHNSLPHSQVILIENCGHSPHLEAIDYVSQTVRQFIL